MDYQHIQQLQKQAAYEQAMGAQQGNSQCLGMLHQDGRLEAQGWSTQAQQKHEPGLMDGLRGLHDFIDRLNGSLNALEGKLSPILTTQATNSIGGIPPAPPSSELDAIEQLAMALRRLQMLEGTIDSLTGRARI
ncbi:hypothetical protein FSO04_24215 [Paraburkholderia madseniana]|uniref:Uncharacterized protein n=1 Tax=Paraburkholderia madseniana TaxID=2599607 RepID=A0A6N6WBI3_9BURK|nr:hypothetical protein [Paraburkholderia madseniana]KAE8757329.1 hypothetical protein FSO04_24215 [Paraburkholderia madseniana]